MKKICVVLSLSVMTIFWYSCTKDTAPAPIVNIGNCDSTKVNFTKDLKPIIHSTCEGASCHSPGSGQSDFTSATVTRTDIDNILCRIQAPGTSFCGARMPQGLPPLADSVKAVFVNWQADGFYDCQ
ncbi:MAG: hypothetical protein JSS76_07740 [Bacteroidetes bacterium]|nr:hypothetical protein [Bacteroidota bacterium]MBS1684628.1 hypothetical protein [Bacteroidota bacterium]